MKVKPSELLGQAMQDVADGKAADLESAISDRISKFSAENVKNLVRGLARLMTSQRADWQDSLGDREARIQSLERELELEKHVITSYSIHYTKLYEEARRFSCETIQP